MNEVPRPIGERPEAVLTHLLAHEARTLLNAIGGFAELLVAGAYGGLGADAHAVAAEIVRAARELEGVLAAAAAILEPAPLHWSASERPGADAGTA